MGEGADMVRGGVRDVVACLALAGDDDDSADGLHQRVTEIVSDRERSYAFSVAATGVVRGLLRSHAHATGVSVDEAAARLFRGYLEDRPT